MVGRFCFLRLFSSPPVPTNGLFLGTPRSSGAVVAILTKDLKKYKLRYLSDHFGCLCTYGKCIDLGWWESSEIRDTTTTRIAAAARGGGGLEKHLNECAATAVVAGNLSRRRRLRRPTKFFFLFFVFLSDE